MVTAGWLALAAWALLVLRPHLAGRRARPAPAHGGEYQKVQGFLPPLSLRLESGLVVKPAGVAGPGEQPAAEHAASRLRELAPPGADLYVELQPRAAEAESAAPPASLWLPPPGGGRPEPFPYERARLIGAILVQEGLAAVDPDASYIYKNEFLLLEDDARRHRRGIWAER